MTWEFVVFYLSLWGMLNYLSQNFNTFKLSIWIMPVNFVLQMKTQSRFTRIKGYKILVNFAQIFFLILLRLNGEWKTGRNIIRFLSWSMCSRKLLYLKINKDDFFILYGVYRNRWQQSNFWKLSDGRKYWLGHCT